ncbi:MAG: peptidoglycan-binding protein [Treponema sp.]|nr:peptidoglycan-binding protein [Treponema sp.]
MRCDDLFDRVYEFSRMADLPLLFRLQIRLHCLFCPQCARELERFRLVQAVLRNDFLPPGADFADAVMARLEAENPALFDAEEGLDGIYDETEGVSLRFWVVTGFILLFSLSSSFFGMDFIKAAVRESSSYLLPLGITIGAVLTCYGAIFIGSHIKELSERFGLH